MLKSTTLNDRGEKLRQRQERLIATAATTSALPVNILHISAIYFRCTLKPSSFIKTSLFNNFQVGEVRRRTQPDEALHNDTPITTPKIGTKSRYSGLSNHKNFKTEI